MTIIRNFLGCVQEMVWTGDRYGTPPPTHNYAEVPPTWFNVIDLRHGGCKSKFGRSDKDDRSAAAVPSPLTDHWGVPLSCKTNRSRTKYRLSFKTQQGMLSFPEYTDVSESQVFKPNSADLAAVQAASIGPHYILPTQRKAY